MRFIKKRNIITGISDNMYVAIVNGVNFDIYDTLTYNSNLDNIARIDPIAAVPFEGTVGDLFGLYEDLTIDSLKSCYKIVHIDDTYNDNNIDYCMYSLIFLYLSYLKNTSLEVK